MKKPKANELTKDLTKSINKAETLEWVTVVYLATVIFLMYKVLGSSQAMKTAWLEDVLSIVPAISFLVAKRIYNRQASNEFPYGFHRVYDIAFLAGSLALFFMGVYLCLTSVKGLIVAEHPTIGSWYIFGSQVWLGWIMIAVLLYSSIPAMWLGRKKLPLAKELHNKILYTDAKAQKADYVTAFAAICGILGVGLGFWWADALAATLISFSVIKDGFTNLKESVRGLMDRRPQKVQDSKPDPFLNDILTEVKRWDWVDKAGVRFREYGQVYVGEILVVPLHNPPVNEWQDAAQNLTESYWQLQDVTLMPVTEIPENFQS